MKFTLMLTALLSLSLFACGEKTETEPDKVQKEEDSAQQVATKTINAWIEAINAKDFETAVTYVVKEEQEDAKRRLERMSSSDLKRMSSSDLTLQSLAMDGELAVGKMEIKQQSPDGEANSIVIDVVLVLEDGDYKVSRKASKEYEKSKAQKMAAQKSASVKSSINALLDLVKKGDNRGAAGLIAYRGKDKARRWKDVCNYDDDYEKVYVDKTCEQIKKILALGELKYLEFESEKESGVEWLIWKVQAGEKKKVFAMLAIKDGFALGDID